MMEEAHNEAIKSILDQVTMTEDCGIKMEIDHEQGEKFMSKQAENVEQQSGASDEIAKKEVENMEHSDDKSIDESRIMDNNNHNDDNLIAEDVNSKSTIGVIEKGSDHSGKSPGGQEHSVDELSANQMDTNETTNGHESNDLKARVDEVKIEPTPDDVEVPSYGRNRRVRLKNRLFNDFHCLDLTKGGGRGSVKDDYNTFTTGSHTRSNRSQTTSTNNIHSNNNISSANNNNINTTPLATNGTRPASDQTDSLFETKYCRRCSSRTAHDPEGCQSCLYKKIIGSGKKKTPTGARRGRQGSAKKEAPATRINRSETSKKQNTSKSPIDNNSIISHNNQNTIDNINSIINRRTSNDNIKSVENHITKNKDEHHDIADNTVPIILKNNRTSPVSLIGNKKNDIVNHLQPIEGLNNGIATTITPNTNINSNPSSCISTTTSSITTTTITTPTTTGSSNHDINGKNDISVDKTGRVDLWTPSEVRDYMERIGFQSEAALFEQQSVDGVSLLLMQRTDYTYNLKLKLGPALKIYNLVSELKNSFFRYHYPALPSALTSHPKF